MNKLKIGNRRLENRTHDLRSKGIIPGTIYGPSIKSTPIKIAENELKRAITQSGEVYQVMSKNGPVFVKFDDIQTDPVSKDFVHFSLVQLPKGIENEVDIPVNLKGTPVGVKKGGTLVIMKDEITVNGVPRSIPEEVVANVSAMDIGDKLTIEDLKIPKRVDSVEDENEIIAICKPPAKVVPTLLEEELEDNSNLSSKQSLNFPARTI